MQRRLVRPMTALPLLLLLLVFSGVKSAEILHPLEEATQSAHHQHDETVLEGPHFHEVHFCAHLQNLGPATAPPDTPPLETSVSPSIRRSSLYFSPTPSSSLGRGPPEFAVS